MEAQGDDVSCPQLFCPSATEVKNKVFVYIHEYIALFSFTFLHEMFLCLDTYEKLDNG